MKVNSLEQYTLSTIEDIVRCSNFIPHFKLRQMQIYYFICLTILIINIVKKQLRFIGAVFLEFLI